MVHMNDGNALNCPVHLCKELQGIWSVGEGDDYLCDLYCTFPLKSTWEKSMVTIRAYLRQQVRPEGFRAFGYSLK